MRPGPQVYYLILAWTSDRSGADEFPHIDAAGADGKWMRDNFERAQFIGYDPRMVRFLQFALSGFSAGIGGWLYAYYV